MSKKYSLFSYKQGNSFLHRCPAWIKILFIPLLSILFLCLPVYFSLGLFLVQFIIACCLGFTLREQTEDLKPILFYILILLFVQILGWAFGGGITADAKESLNNFIMTFSWEEQKDSVFMLAKLFVVMQTASLVFKTSTSLQMRSGIESIENGVCKVFHKKSRHLFTDAISLFLNFIPMVAQVWNQSKRAWFARGGKNSIKMYATLLPVLFSVGMKKAYNSARALSIRK